jgi:uncharacterized glyoxalase superfamily protein PhnB
MRFMVLIKANADSEAGLMPSEALLTEMGAFNEELVKAGVMLAGEGLQPTSKGARVRFSGKGRQVIDGPFAETKELIAGYWLWQLNSLQEAIDWVKRCPNPTGEEAEVEIRQLFEAECFGEAFTPELRAQEERLRAAVKAVPPARGATPYLVIRGAADAIGFYQKVFDAELVIRLDAPDGKPMHAELKVGPASFMLTEERPEYGALSPLTIGGSASTSTIYVPDADAVVAAALAGGAQSVMPVQDQFWGDRSGAITDPFGHKWMIATHLEDPSHEEIEHRMQALFAAKA